MTYHNETCGCAECGNYGQSYNPQAIHNQSCGCAECGNYPQTSSVRSKGARPAPSAPEEVMVAVPVQFLEEVRALIGRQRGTVS